MNNIALGRYLPLNSIVHRMDPRAKIGAMLLVMIAIFIPAGYSGYALLGVIVCAVALLARLQFSFIWRAMRPMLFMLVFLLVINLLVIHDGYVLLSIGSFHIYSGAVSQTLYIVIRLALMVTITTILTATTKPLDLTLGIEDLLKPFQKIGLPAHEIAMMISIALRFIPTLIEETQRIMGTGFPRRGSGERNDQRKNIRYLIIACAIACICVGPCGAACGCNGSKGLCAWQTAYAL